MDMLDRGKVPISSCARTPMQDKRVKSLLAMMLTALAASPAPAAIIIDAFNPWDGSKVQFWPFVAETFVAPPGQTLSEFHFGIERYPKETLRFQIRPWGSSGPTGDAIFSRT